MSGKNRFGRWIATLVVAGAAVAPAVAHAAPTWNRVADPAPGGTVEYYDGYPVISVTIAGATPYLATESTGNDLTVWRPNAAGSAWVQVGAKLNHVPLQSVQDPIDRHQFFSIDSGATKPWIVWSEPDGGARRLHVARLGAAGFEETAATWPTTAAAWPQVVVYDGRPYVTTESSDVLRLTDDGSGVEHVTDGLPDGCHPELTVAAGRLYATCGHTELLRLNGAGSAWEHVLTHSEPFYLLDATGTPYLIGIRNLGGTGLYGLRPGDQTEKLQGDAPTRGPVAAYKGRLYVAHSGATPAADILTSMTLEGLVADGWFSAPSPSQASEGAIAWDLVEGADRNLWVVWHAQDNFPGVEPPRTVHVARFAEQGEPFAFAPDAPAMPSGPPETPAPTPPAHSGGGDGGFTTPGGDPVPDAPGPVWGACANALLGTVGGDRIVGSVRGDRISGRAGNDHLFGRAGSDCVSGGSGGDYVSGGAGRDALSGGSGDDRIVAGGSADDVAAGAGADSIHAVGGGVDRVNCGPGRDTARVSRNDLVKSCERVIVVRR